MPAVEMIWYDGGIKPKRPAELLPDEPLGEWDGGILFEGTKGKIMARSVGKKSNLVAYTKNERSKIARTEKSH